MWRILLRVLILLVYMNYIISLIVFPFKISDNPSKYPILIQKGDNNYKYSSKKKASNEEKKEDKIQINANPISNNKYNLNQIKTEENENKNKINSRNIQLKVPNLSSIKKKEFHKKEEIKIVPLIFPKINNNIYRFTYLLIFQFLTFFIIIFN